MYRRDKDKDRWQMTDPPSRQRGRHKKTYCNGQTQYVKYGHESQ
jgi:hypothetical protein